VISEELVISIGIIERAKQVYGVLNGFFELQNFVRLDGTFRAIHENGRIVLFDDEDVEVARAEKIRCIPLNSSTFTLCQVPIGTNFHWERKEDQIFEGTLLFLAQSDGTVTVINEVGVESYLKSVISSEMSAEAPLELLKAHAMTSRSWLVSMLERQKRLKKPDMPSLRSQKTKDEILRWYDREDHAHFDVCADDHCQRYHGITKVISKSAAEAVSATRGQFLVYDNEICDARFSKACGGRTELFEHTWEDTTIPYLQSVSDSVINYPPVDNESDAKRWIFSSPDAYCNTADGKMLQHVLPVFDQETTDFFRWKIEYPREQLEDILTLKSGIDFGTLMDILPLKRGPSGRIYKLKIVGSKQTMIVGKELEVRRWLSNSHLYSSAFIVTIERDTHGVPKQFIFHGSGWGHGVGLCQIGAAVMAVQGFTAEDILKHYFSSAEILRLY
jgi:stage II sporulation protein D